MVAILEKSDAAQGFEKIIDFLSGSYLQHALTVNPHVYISCIKQFWNTAVVKRSGDVTRLQALVDKKRIVITKEVVREILQLDDAEGIICLPNDEIFAGLARMGYEKPFTKLTFYKAYFSSQWKFFIHTLLHSLSANKLHGTSSVLQWHQHSSVSPKVKGLTFQRVKIPLFENILEVRAVDAEEEVQVPAQDGVVQENVTEEIADDVAQPTSPLPPSTIIPSTPPHQSPSLPSQQAAEGLETANTAQQLEILKLKARVKKLERLNKVKSSKLRCLKKVGTSQRVESSEDIENVFKQGRISVDMDEGIELVVDQEKNAEVEGRHADTQVEIYNIDLDHSSKVLSMQEDTEVQEAVEVMTTAKLITKVVTTAATQVTAASAHILAAKPKVLKIAAATPAVSTRKRKGVKDQVEMDAEYARKLQEELNKEHKESFKNIDWNASFNHVQAKETQYIKRYHGFKKKPQSESEARKNMISYLRNTEGFKMEFFKGLKFDDILPIFQARFEANLKFLFKTREEIEKEDEEIIKSINKTPAQKETKRRRLNEQAKEDEALGKQLEVVVDEDDDVFLKATPIGKKVPVVNYEIVMINNKPRYKIIRADDTHQLYTSFITLMKNFDREDLEDLWKIMKARFSTSKPANFTDDYLLSTLKTMLEKTDGQDVIWRSQQTKYGQALVKS
nr:hypothetical protein [Tanacetum cinerariifolium]